MLFPSTGLLPLNWTAMCSLEEMWSESPVGQIGGVIGSLGDVQSRKDTPLARREGVPADRISRTHGAEPN